MRIVGLVAGVLCTRVRLEEKRLITALGSLGVDVQPLPPSDAPLPIQPLSVNAAGGDLTEELMHVVIDRLQERVTASVWLPYWRQPGREVIDAGVAATLDRLSIARLLAEAGLSRPDTALVISEASGLNAISLFEGRGTLLPVRTGSRELPLPDQETAEAVLEHRSVLGAALDSISLVQRGVATSGNRFDIVVIDGVATAIGGAIPAGASQVQITSLAEETARLLGARLIGVSIAEIDGRLVVWDVDPVPAFRNARTIDGSSVESALADLTVRLSLLTVSNGASAPLASLHREESDDHVFLSA